MRRTAGLYGLLGLVMLAFGAIAAYIAPSFRFFVYVNLIGGVFAIVLWITSSRSALASMVGQRSARYGANAVIYTVAFVGVLVAINYLGAIHHRRIDMTAEKVYSLSSQSTNVVRQLKEPIKLIGFFKGGLNPAAQQLYSTYAYISPRVTYQLVDPDRHPELAERYKVTQIGTTHIQYGPDDTGEGRNVTDLSEEAITNAIIQLTRGGKKVVNFLDGHGEGNPDDTRGDTGYGALKQALEGEGYEVAKLDLASLAKVPDDVTMVIVAGPTRPLLPGEIDRLDAYLKQGGRLLVTLRPPRPDQPIDESALIGLLGKWGIKVENDVVVDQVLRLFQGPALGLAPFVQEYGASPIAKDFHGRTVFPMSRSLELSSDAKPGLALVALAKTSDTSWGETDLAGVFSKQTAKLDSNDIRGPVTVAATVDADLGRLGWGKGDARLVVLGSTEAADNQYLGDFFNRDFLVNSADWLVGEENAISIRPRSLRASRFRLTVNQFSVIFALSVLIMPELLLIAGIAVWYERRI
jgi:gliding motility-associatede transport system auxiliary component